MGSAAKQPVVFPLLEPVQRRALARKLVAWFGKAARTLPWRGTNDLYAIWVSEIMLQQTQVATVIPYYGRFIARFPTVAALAAAEERDVLRLWEGLGYYRRARQMHAAARVIAQEHQGAFPTSYAAVRALPGIGRYTAGAILSIGLNQRLPILEANTVRVLSRLAAWQGNASSTRGQKHLWSLAEAILPASGVGTFNQALMELGSLVCTPKDPQCDGCPVRMHCGARTLGLVGQIPSPTKKPKYEEVVEVAVVVRRGRKVLVRQCQPGQRWAGLWDFPRFSLSEADCTSLNGPQSQPDENGSQALITASDAAIADRLTASTGVQAEIGELLTTLKHGVTRFRITLECYAARWVASGHGPVPIRWVTLAELSELPLSTTGRKISNLLCRGKKERE